MPWNVRLHRADYKDPSGDTEQVYDLRECYYNEEGGLTMCTAVAVPVRGYSFNDVLDYIRKTIEALRKPVVMLTKESVIDTGTTFNFLSWRDVFDGDKPGSRILSVHDAEDAMIKGKYDYILFRGKVYKRISMLRFEETGLTVNELI